MLKGFLSRLLVGALAIIALTSCGDKAPGTGDFITVTASVAAPPGTLYSDVAKWVDATTLAKSTPCATNAVPQTSPDILNYSITSKAYTPGNTGQSNPTSASNLQVARITLTYTPVDPTNSPALPIQYPSSGEIIAPNTTQSIPIEVVPDSVKQFFLNPAVAGGLAISCSGTTELNKEFSYYVQVTFQLIETDTKREQTVSAPGLMVVRISDRTD